MRHGLPPLSRGSARPWQRPDILEKFATMKPIKYASNGFRKKFGKVMLALACGSSLVIAPSGAIAQRSEEHTSELQSLMRISYAVFCLKKKTKTTPTSHNHLSIIPQTYCSSNTQQH